MATASGLVLEFRGESIRARPLELPGAVITDTSGFGDPHGLCDDAESRALLGDPSILPRLVQSPTDVPVRWLLTHAEFLPELLRAAAGGQDSVRPVLWHLADRYGVRLFADGTAVLATGVTVSWDDLPQLAE